jgi:hypothetical protein
MTDLVCGICGTLPEGYSSDENLLPCGHHCGYLVEVAQSGDSFVATTPQPDSLLPADYLERIHPTYAFRTLQCRSCGCKQYDAGQNACLICGTMWSLVQVWPEEEPSR